jgi:hypothetical protein
VQRASALRTRAGRNARPPSNLTGGAAGKVVTKLLTEGLIEEIQSRGSLPIWRRDEDGPSSLRISKKGLQAIQVEDEASGSAESAKKPPAPFLCLSIIFTSCLTPGSTDVLSRRAT